MRRACALAVAALTVLVVSGASGGNGNPPRQCSGDLEFKTNFTCLVQSHAATFTLAPHEVKVGGTITATLISTGDFDLVRVNWSTLESTFGTPPGTSCGIVDLGKGAKSICKFKVTRPTGGWSTVTLGFGTTIGPAESRDYYAASSTAPPPPTTTAKAELPRQNKPPSAAFTSSTDDLLLRVDGSASRDPDGHVVRYSWSFDGKPFGRGLQRDEHRFAKAGRYEIRLVVTDNDGATDPAARSVCVACSDPDGLDWAMPDRLAATVKKWGSQVLLDRSSVHPDAWVVNLFLTAGGKQLASCPPDVQWRWTVAAPPGAKVTREPADGCTPSMKVSDLGTYKVSATKYEKEGGVWTKTPVTVRREVVVKDWLIVGIGDSNGSGEGNPPFQVPQCNRGLASYQYQTAKYIEDHDPRSSVTFVFASCSGATIENLYTLPYEGIRPGALLGPQVGEVGYLLGPRRGVAGDAGKRPPDAVIMSIGVNNIGFGPLMTTCVILYLANSIKPPCETVHVRVIGDGKGRVTTFSPARVGPGLPTLRASLDTLLDRLLPKYGPLARALAAPLTGLPGGGMGIKNPSRVFITQYPDFTTGEGGKLCEKGASLASWQSSDWQWLGLSAGRLNSIVGSAAAAHGWTLVPIGRSAFAGHGYCAPDSYFVGIYSATKADDAAGPFHPNVRGHEVTALATRARVCAALYGNPDCDGTAKS